MKGWVFLVVVAVIAVGAFYLGTQSQEPEGPAESFGRSLDESAKKAKEKLKELADDVEKAVEEDRAGR